MHAFFTIQLQADQIVIGTAINFLALGITGYLFTDLYDARGIPPDVPAIPDVTIAGLKDRVTFFGPIFGDLNLMIWLASSWFLLSCIDHVQDADRPAHPRLRRAPAGGRYRRHLRVPVRYGRSSRPGGLAAMGGAYLTARLHEQLQQNMTAGRGFIALAALIFGNWRPFGAFAAALLFGFSTALGVPSASIFGELGDSALPGASVPAHPDRRRRCRSAAPSLLPPLDALTRSSSSRGRNDAARGSVLLALVGLAIPPLGFLAARRLDQVTLIQATAATCGSAVLGATAIALARRARRNVERSIGRIGGEATARVGRLLGGISLFVGLTAALALGFYGLLNLFG